MKETPFLLVEESHTLKINTLSKLLESQGKEIYKFGFGQSPFQPPVDVIKAARENAYRTDYTHVQGDIELRENISRFHKHASGIESTPEDVFVAPGSKILLFSILRSFEKADVLVSSPSWVSYRPQVNICGHNLINIKTNFDERWRITPKNIKEALRHKKYNSSILIINYPGNPDGLSYTVDELKQLGKVLEENGVLVISDEIYSLLSFDNPIVSFVNYYSNTITTTGLSKWCGAGGWRLGIALLGKGVSPCLKESMIGIASETYSCAPAPIQSAAKVAYQNYNERKDYLRYQKSILKIISQYCFQKLIFAKIKLHPSEGGFYHLPDFSEYRSSLNSKGILSSNDLCETILKETGVALLPGSAFGISPEHLVARLAFVDIIQPKDLSKFSLEVEGKKVVTGIEKLVDWLNSQ